MALLGSAPQRAPSGGGVTIKTGLSPDDIAARSKASQDAANAARDAAQAKIDAENERQRQVQIERDMAAANQQNAVNTGGTQSGEWGYAYTDGGGGGSSRSASSGGGGGGGGESAAPRSIDLSQLSALKAQVVPAAVPPPSYAQNQGVADQAFARAKDKAGLLALRRMSDSRREFAQRGITGGGGEARAMDDVLGDASSGLQDFALGQAQTEAGLARQATDRDYAGAIQQRGQDMSFVPTLLSLLRASQGAVY